MTLKENWQEHEHTYKKWFWRANYPVAILLYIFTDEKILLFYTLLCSVYANEETSASAEEAKKAQSESPLGKIQKEVNHLLKK
jgi:hypothetical protein